MSETISIQVTGKVQGVFFRHSTKQKAVELALAGEVKNMDDGSVFIIATGPREQLNALAEWCKQGPPRAKICSVKVTEMALQEFEEFSIVR